MDRRRIEAGDSDYPVILRDRLGDAAPSCLYAMGNAAILRNCLLGLVCSIRCPGSVVIKTFDAIRALRDAGVGMIGGFHSPMERECLDILLRGDQSVILCAAKGLPGLRLGQGARRAVREGRLLLISPFYDTVRRTTAAQAVERNQVVAMMSKVLLVPFASPEGKTWANVSAAIERGQLVCTFADSENAALIAAGVKPMTAADMARAVTATAERRNQNSET